MLPQHSTTERYTNLYSEFITDEVITREKVLEKISQEEIFSLLCGYVPVEFQRVVSPLREDHNPGCWFEYYLDTLYFKDFAFQPTSMDCFTMAMIKFNLSSYHEAVQLIYNLTKGKTIRLEAIKVIKRLRKPKKNLTRIFFEPRYFSNQDLDFWGSYNITRQQLIDDKVFAVKKYSVGINELHTEVVNGLCYAYTNFKNNKVKLYFPQRVEKRFITNCTANDIGCIAKNKTQNTLIITKSYKDARVLCNAGFCTIWLQNEGMIPSSITELVQPYRKVVILFDNDQQGIIASSRLEGVLKKELTTVNWRIPLEYEVKDSAEFVQMHGEEKLKTLLNHVVND